MKKEYDYYVYIMASASGTLYVGITKNIIHRSLQHKQGKTPGFTQKYKCSKLVYYEHFTDVYNAIDREKQIKRWNRTKKERLIKKQNPHWKDLSQDWGFQNIK